MNSKTIEIKGLSVMLGIPSGRHICWQTAMAFHETLSLLREMNIPCTHSIVTGCAIVTKARDEVLNDFMQSDANRLLWIDDDIVWSAKDVVRLLALSMEHEVIGASYPAKTEPTTYYIKVNDLKNIPRNEMGLLEVDGLGLGFTVMNREVAQSLCDRGSPYRDPMTKKTLPGVFRTDTLDGNFRGEDMAMFADIRELGYKVWLDPLIELGHQGGKIYRGRLQDAISNSATEKANTPNP